MKARYSQGVSAVQAERVGLSPWAGEAEGVGTADLFSTDSTRR